jgi:hypothetical protein
MDHATSSEKSHNEQSQKNWLTLLTSSSEMIGIFIAVAIVVAGSILVFGNNANKGNQRQEQRREKVQKERLTTKNVSSKLSENTKKIKKRVARAKRNLRNASRASSETRTLANSTAVTSEGVRVQADRRIAQLWQAQNATWANRDLSVGLRNQISRKINGKIGKLHTLKRSIREDDSQDELGEVFQDIQDQKVYSCYLPNISKQTVNEDLAVLAREQNDLTRELRSASNDFKKQGRRTEKLNKLINDRNKELRQIMGNVQAVRQNSIQAENTNCVSPTPPEIEPIVEQFDDLANLDEQIRLSVDAMLREQDVRKNVTTAPRQKIAKKEARQEEKADKKSSNITPEPTVLVEEEPEPSEEMPEEEPAQPEETPEATPSEEESSGDPLEKPNFSALGLPNPTSAGVADLKSQIQDDERATWAVKALLKGEKTAIDKGMDVIPYLTTGWIWFENGSAAWPDPYEINCNDNRSGYYSEVSIICTVSNFQIAGYQAAAQSGQYVSLFTKFYEPEELADVVKRVASDATNAIRPQWNYNDSGQQKGVNKQYITQLGSVKIGDISPNVDFFSEKGQYFTLLAGKDPTMAIALNSFAVSEDDLVSALKAGCAYGYICGEEKQVLANMVGALYELDGGSL